MHVKVSHVIFVHGDVLGTEVGGVFPLGERTELCMHKCLHEMHSECYYDRYVVGVEARAWKPIPNILSEGSTVFCGVVPFFSQYSESKKGFAAVGLTCCSPPLTILSFFLCESLDWGHDAWET